MPHPDRIATSLRITRDEAMLIRPGLFRIVIAHRKWKERGASLVPPAPLGPDPNQRNDGKYSAGYQMGILHAAVVATNSFKARSRRLRLDAFELPACILGVRATEMMCRHGHITPVPPQHTERTRRLLNKLERLRKRAKRAYIRAYGRVAFAQASLQWQQHVRFVRAFFLYCSCNRRPLVASEAKVRRRELVEKWVEFFQGELTELGLRVPPEAELRNLVKRAVRSGRRCFGSYGRRFVRDHPGFLEERIRRFVVDRCLKTLTSEV